MCHWNLRITYTFMLKEKANQIELILEEPKIMQQHKSI